MTSQDAESKDSGCKPSPKHLRAMLDKGCGHASETRIQCRKACQHGAGSMISLLVSMNRSILSHTPSMTSGACNAATPSSTSRNHIARLALQTLFASAPGPGRSVSAWLVAASGECPAPSKMSLRGHLEEPVPRSLARQPGSTSACLWSILGLCKKTDTRVALGPSPWQLWSHLAAVALCVQASSG